MSATDIRPLDRTAHDKERTAWVISTLILVAVPPVLGALLDWPVMLTWVFTIPGLALSLDDRGLGLRPVGPGQTIVTAVAVGLVVWGVPASGVPERYWCLSLPCTVLVASTARRTRHNRRRQGSMQAHQGSDHTDQHA